MCFTLLVRTLRLVDSFFLSPGFSMTAVIFLLLTSARASLVELLLSRFTSAPLFLSIVGLLLHILLVLALHLHLLPLLVLAFHLHLRILAILLLETTTPTPLTNPILTNLTPATYNH